MSSLGSHGPASPARWWRHPLSPVSTSRALGHRLNLWRCSALVAPRVRGPLLETLNLCECVQLVDRALPPLCTACPALRTLMIAGCESLSGELGAPAPSLLGLPALQSGFGGPGLTMLDVSDIRLMNDELLSAVCAASPNLRRLDISRSGNLVQSPVVGGPQLTSLVSTRCQHLGDDAVSAACDASPRLTSLMLALCGTLYSPRMHGALLSDVNLSGCAQLQDAAVSYLCGHSPLLSRLSLSLCPCLAEPLIHGACLKRVELSHCEHLSAPTVHGPLVEYLNLSGCAALEDAALEAACTHCPRLIKLSINGCGRLVAARLISPSLQTLNCQQVAPAVVEGVTDRARLPALKRVVSEEPQTIEEVD